MYIPYQRQALKPRVIVGRNVRSKQGIRTISSAIISSINSYIPARLPSTMAASESSVFSPMTEIRSFYGGVAGYHQPHLPIWPTGAEFVLDDIEGRCYFWRGFHVCGGFSYVFLASHQCRYVSV